MITINLKNLLEDQDLTMTDLHKGTGISKNTLSLMANGVSKGIQFDTLDKILEFLSVDVGALIIFTSTKEIDNLIVSITDLHDDAHELVENWNPIFTPPSPRIDGESDAAYEARLEKDDDLERPTIGYTNQLRIYKKFQVNLDYDDFQCKFVIPVKFIAEGIDEKDKVKKRYTQSKNYDGESFDEVMWLNQVALILVENFYRNMDKLSFNTYQINIVKNKIIAELKENLPVEFTDFIKEMDIVEPHREDLSITFT